MRKVVKTSRYIDRVIVTDLHAAQREIGLKMISKKFINHLIRNIFESTVRGELKMCPKTRTQIK